jgi:hypothetical protein
MKKTALFLLILNATSGFAGSYEAIVSNDDGSVSILQPRFNNPMGTGGLGIDIQSDLAGVCRLFGFSGYVPSSMSRSLKNPGTVLIDASGRFSGFGKSECIGDLACESGAPAVSTNYESLLPNDDGTFTVLKPRFRMAGENFQIHSDSDADGICRLFGKTKYVAHSMTNDPVRSRYSVQVTGSPKFGRFMTGGALIYSLICE